MACKASVTEPITVELATGVRITFSDIAALSVELLEKLEFACKTALFDRREPDKWVLLNDKLWGCTKWPPNTIKIANGSYLFRWVSKELHLSTGSCVEVAEQGRSKWQVNSVKGPEDGVWQALCALVGPPPWEDNKNAVPEPLPCSWNKNEGWIPGKKPGRVWYVQQGRKTELYWIKDGQIFYKWRGCKAKPLSADEDKNGTGDDVRRAICNFWHKQR